MQQENDQLTIIYKLGTLEALVTTGLKNIKEQLDDVKHVMEVHKTQTKQELEAIEIRLAQIENWKRAVVERVTVITGVCLVAWALVGDWLKDFILRIF
jgi:chaperone required for assembly of F1-ATPase